MKKQELCQLLQVELKEHFNSLNINNINNYIWTYLSVTGRSKSFTLDEFRADSSFLKWITQLKLGIPIQYVLHNSCFYGLDFEVNTSVLIPRPETEELVAWMLKDYSNLISYKIIDIGTGSGCIAITFKVYRPNWKVTAIDISTAALEVARKNANSHNQEIEFIQLDFLNDNIKLDEYDLIISNPPYISRNEIQISESVLLEPHIALFPEGEDPLVFYREIAKWAKSHLKQSGSIYLEMNEFLYLEIKEIFQEAGYLKITLSDDMQGKKRMIKVQF